MRDEEVADMLRRTGKKVVLVINKIDNPSNLPDFFYDFYELGLGEPIPISSANMLNFGDVLDEIVSGFPDGAYSEEDDDIKIAVIGKPNVGKSSLINCLLGENRVIVSPIAGTTRDSIDRPFEKDGEKYTFDRYSRHQAPVQDKRRYREVFCRKSSCSHREM